MKIIGYHFGLMVAATDDGAELPITTLIDEYGDETEDCQDAVVFVCGSDAAGWFAERIEDFHNPAVH